MLFNFWLIYALPLQLDHKFAKGRDPVLSFFVSSLVFSTVSYAQ